LEPSELLKPIITGSTKSVIAILTGKLIKTANQNQVFHTDISYDRLIYGITMREKGKTVKPFLMKF